MREGAAWFDWAARPHKRGPSVKSIQNNHSSLLHVGPLDDLEAAELGGLAAAQLGTSHSGFGSPRHASARSSSRTRQPASRRRRR